MNPPVSGLKPTAYSLQPIFKVMKIWYGFPLKPYGNDSLLNPKPQTLNPIFKRNHHPDQSGQLRMKMSSIRTAGLRFA